MKLLESILVAVDFSPSADDAVRVAAGVARAFGSRVVLLYVMPEVHDSPVAQQMLEEKSHERLAEIAGRMRAGGVERVEDVVLPGVAFDRIRRYAAEHDVNIIMIGAGRKPGDEPFQLGTTAARICREAGKPVWVVKPGAPERIERILCAVDFSDSSRRALTNAVHLARSFHAELTVLTAVPPLANWLGEAPADAQEAFVAVQRARFDEFLEPLDFHGVSHQAVVRLGQPHEQIRAAVAELGADLLVIGSVGRTGLARMLMGSVAEKVAREMPCSIITVKAEHAIRLKVDEEIADIQAHFHQGRELLDGGFPAEAAGQFRQCIADSPVYAPAWEGLAESLSRLGRDSEAEDARRHARQIVHTLWDRQIEAEIRSQHALWRKK